MPTLHACALVCGRTNPARKACVVVGTVEAGVGGNVAPCGRFARLELPINLLF